MFAVWHLLILHQLFFHCWVTRTKLDDAFSLGSYRQRSSLCRFDCWRSVHAVVGRAATRSATGQTPTRSLRSVPRNQYRRSVCGVNPCMTSVIFSAYSVVGNLTGWCNCVCVFFDLPSACWLILFAVGRCRWIFFINGIFTCCPLEKLVYGVYF